MPDLRWLHALARQLALSESDADDLVQETWMYAEGTGSKRPVEGKTLRAWLAGVLRNRERMLRRAEGRRRRREAEAASELSEATQAELVLHRDRVLSSLRELLDELDEDDRALLLARYCDEHAAPELADRLGLPASTVRSRLSRATARVRQGLDERWGGDRRAWAPAILVAPMPGASSAVVGTTGASMMSTKLVAMLVAMLVAAGAWVWFAGSDGEDGAPADVAVDGDAEELARRRAARGEESLATDASALRGTVVDASTGRPIASAVVVLARASGSPGLVRPGSTPNVPRTRTDVGGGFVFEAVPVGTYHVTAAAPGYLPAELENLELGGRAAASPTLALQPGGNALTGTVTDIGGGPVAGTWVVARTRADAIIGAQRAGYAALTNDEGAFTLSLPDGNWTVQAGGDDYGVAQTRLSLRSSPGRADFELVPAAIIRGRVVDRRSGTAVAGAVVGFERFIRKGDGFSVDQSKAEEVAVADAHGNFTLRPLQPATYTLYASAAQLGTIAETVVPVDIAEQVSGVEVTVDPAFDGGGFVVDATDRSRGLGGIAVHVYATDPSRSFFTTTAPDGSFSVHGLMPGVYTAMFEGAGVIPSGLDHSLRVEAGAANDGLFALERGTSVRGRVTPVRAGSVKLENREKTGGFEVMLAAEKLKNARARIAGDGTFAIEGVAPGAWEIVVTADDGSTGVLAVDVAAQPIDGLAIELWPRAIARGRVVGPDGVGIAGLAVRLQQERPRPFGPSVVATATSDGGGAFEMIGVDAGTYDVAVVDVTGQPVAFDRPVEPAIVGEDGVTELELAVHPPQGRIEGRVHGADGEPIVDAFVVAQAVGSGVFESGERTVITAADGRFVVEGLADRRYSLHARGPGERGRVSLSEVGIGQSVDLVLAPLARVRGTVRMDGKLVERFTVESGDARRARTFITTSGTFELDRVEPGKLRVAVTTDAGAASVAFALAPGA
ncbi:MAG: sigma-70 family RNA polymerase sigma factor, partial [Deltaproteobacteria bacterium]|nr:sigma-70 family RNA polymerase sigma factor [Nannocystaceae bacterium]